MGSGSSCCKKSKICLCLPKQKNFSVQSTLIKRAQHQLQIQEKRVKNKAQILEGRLLQMMNLTGIRRNPLLQRAQIQHIVLLSNKEKSKQVYNIVCSTLKYNCKSLNQNRIQQYQQYRPKINSILVGNQILRLQTVGQLCIKLMKLCQNIQADGECQELDELIIFHYKSPSKPSQRMILEYVWDLCIKYGLRYQDLQIIHNFPRYR